MSEAITSYTTHNNVRGQTLTYWADSTVVLANHQRGRSSNGLINGELRKLAVQLEREDVSLTVRWGSRETRHGKWADQLPHCSCPQDVCRSSPGARF